MKIYKNQYVSQPCYFVRIGANTKACQNGASLSTGYAVELCNGKWKCKRVDCYDSLLNSNFVCVVENEESANCFIENAIINAVLALIPKAKREKDEGLKAAQRLILTWLSSHPNKLEDLKSVISPKDFSDPLYQKVARILYRQIEQRSLSLVEMLANFTEDKNEYREVAKIFNEEPIQSFSVRNCVIRLKRHSLQNEADVTDDVKRLQEVMEELKGLDYLNISF